MLIDNMTPKEFIKNRTFLFFNPITNIKEALSTKRTSTTLEVFSDFNLIKNTLSTKNQKKQLIKNTSMTTTSTLDFFDGLDISLLIKKVN